MNGLLPVLLNQPFELGQVVEVTSGPLSGIRGVLIKLADDGRAVIQLDERQGIFLVVSAENLGLEGSGGPRPDSQLATVEI